MRNIYKAWLGVMACVCAGSVSAQTYVSPITPYQDVTTNGQTFTFTFNAPPSGAHSQAQLKVYFEGDFGDSYETIEVRDEDGNTLGFAGPYSTGQDCSPEESKTFTFDATLINGWLADNNVDFTLLTSYDVDPGLCDTATRMRVQLTYEYCNFGVPQFANFTLSDSLFCAYDASMTLSGTPTGGTFTGTGITGNSFSPAGLSGGYYDITYTAADAFGCVTHKTKQVYVSGSPVALPAHACPGGTAVLEVDAAGGTFVWYSDPALTTSVDSGIVASSPVLNQPATYYVSRISTGLSFEVLSLATANSAVVDHDIESGDDRGGIAVTPDYLYVVGDDYTARFDASDLGNAVSLPIQDGIFSDLKTGKLWALWSTQTGETVSYDTYNFPFMWDALRGLDADLQFTNEYINLSSAVEIGDNVQSGMFAGYGQMGLFNGGDEHAYVVNLTTGDVQDLGVVAPLLYGSENWADWGVLEYNDADYSFLYRVDDGGANITRLNLTTGAVTVTQAFSDISDLSSFTFSPWNNRWYFHYENDGQFGGNSETAGYADGTYAFSPFPVGTPGCYTEVDVDVNVIDLGADQTICDYNAPAVLFAGLGYSSYTWNGENNNYNAFPVMQSGTYTVEAVDEYGCTVTDAAVVTVLPCSGIEEAGLSLSLTLFPNPAHTTAGLRVESAVNQDLTLEVIDMTGKRLYNTRLMGVSGEYTHTLDVAAYAPGVYTVRLIGSEKGSHQIRLIKQ